MSPDTNISPQNENVFGDERRRAFLKNALGLACVTASASMLSSCSLKSADEFSQGKTAKLKNGQLFNQNQMTALYAIVDTVLPRTDTPSASEVNCHNFVQHQLLQCHTEDEQQACIQVVEQIDQHCIENLNKPFALVTQKQQQDVLVKLEQGQGFSGTSSGQFALLKALIVFGYFTSEVGATQALNYQAVPGGFKGSIPCDQNTKSWGSIDYY